MKPRSFLVLGLIAALIPVLANADTSGWTKVRTLPVDFKVNISGFSSDQTALTVGYAGEIHLTADGGSTWPRASNDSACRFGLEIVDQNVAYHCGNLGQVGKTIDGGKTWQRIASFPGSEPIHARYLSFCSPDMGWIANRQKIGASEDGGSSWRKIALPKGMGKILAIARIDKLSGAVFDDKGQLWQTADDGATWSKNLLVGEAFCNTEDFVQVASLRFTDANHLTLLFFRIGDQPTWIARQSSDAGKTWTDSAFAGSFANPWLDRTAHFLTTTDSIKKEIVVYELK